MNTVDLGHVHLHEKVVRSFQLANQGAIPVEFEWEIDGEDAFTVSPKSGQVSVGDRKTMELCFHPTTVQTLKEFKVHCKICSGKVYTFKLYATSHRPAIHLSWASHNFGRVYVHPEGVEPHRKGLILKNNDTQVRLHNRCRADLTTISPPYFWYLTDTNLAETERECFDSKARASSRFCAIDTGAGSKHCLQPGFCSTCNWQVPLPSLL